MVLIGLFYLLKSHFRLQSDDLRGEIDLFLLDMVHVRDLRQGDFLLRGRHGTG